jgi:hypothetical protein
MKSGFETPKHPQLSLMTCKELMTYSVGEDRFTGDFYMIGLKKIKSGHVLYGKTKYDHSNGSTVFMKPRQIIEVSNVQFAEKGFVIFFTKIIYLAITYISRSKIMDTLSMK